MSNAVEALQLINARLFEAQELELYLPVRFRGKPVSRVDSLDPLVIRPYGIRYRAPRLAGEFCLRAMMWKETSQETVRPYGVLEVGENDLEAIRMPLDVLNAIARDVIVEVTFS